MNSLPFPPEVGRGEGLYLPRVETAGLLEIPEKKGVRLWGDRNFLTPQGGYFPEENPRGGRETATQTRLKE